MARIADLIADHRTLSFEFSPPRTEEAERRLEKTLVELEKLRPDFVSVTYGAGGSTRDKTREIVEHIAEDTSMTPMPHLTCVAHTRTEIVDIVTGYRDQGLENILALSGDPPEDGEDYSADFHYAIELVDLVRELGQFSVGVAAHPGTHPRSGGDRTADRKHLAEKLERADFCITQFFWDSSDYFRLVEELAALGVDKPVIPGIMPVSNVRTIERFGLMNNAPYPPDLADRLYRVAEQPAEVRKIGVEVATRLSEEVLAGGAPGLHIYTMNFAGPTKAIYENLGLGR